MPPWETADWDGLPPASLNPWRRCNFPAMGYGLRYEYGMFKQTLEDGWQRERPDNWLRRQDPWEVARPHEKRRSQIELLVRGARRNFAGDPRAAVDPDRDPLRPACCRLWRGQHQYPPAVGRGSTRLLRFSSLQPRRLREAVAETLEAESITRVLYPDDSTSEGQALRFVQEYFLVACSLADLVRRFRRSGSGVGRVSGESRDPAQRYPSHACHTRADAHPAGRRAPRVGSGVGDHSENLRVHQPHAAARGAGEMAGGVV